MTWKGGPTVAKSPFGLDRLPGYPHRPSLVILLGELMPSALTQIKWAANLFRRTEPMCQSRTAGMTCSTVITRTGGEPSARSKSLDPAMLLSTVGDFWIARSSCATTAQ